MSKYITNVSETQHYLEIDLRTKKTLSAKKTTVTRWIVSEEAILNMVQNAIARGGWLLGDYYTKDDTAKIEKNIIWLKQYRANMDIIPEYHANTDSI